VGRLFPERAPLQQASNDFEQDSIIASLSHETLGRVDESYACHSFWFHVRLTVITIQGALAEYLRASKFAAENISRAQCRSEHPPQKPRLMYSFPASPLGPPPTSNTRTCRAKLPMLTDDNGFTSFTTTTQTPCHQCMRQLPSVQGTLRWKPPVPTV
jgi:hypothetical protein